MNVETANRDAKILQWQEAVKALAVAKEAEAALRNEVIAANFASHKEEEGTENIELGNGYKLKAVFKLSYTLDNKEEGVDKALTKLEKMGAEGQFVAERLVRWKPELSVSEYKKLAEKYKKIIDEVLTTKPGLPSLELIEPKSK